MRTTLTRLLAALTVVLAAPAAGADSGADEQIIYWPLISNGTEYRRIPYPVEAGPLIVLAESEIVIEAVRAPVAYWPITREYLADLSKKPEPIAASVEIIAADGTVTTIAPEAYTLWYPAGIGAGPGSLVRGAAARPAYDTYVATARAAAEAAIEYQRLVVQLSAAVDAWLRIAAERPATMPPPPPELDIPEPEPYHAFASEPREAAVTALAEGRYTVRLRGADGTPIAGSERDLIAFAQGGTGIGYLVRPQDRWTRPLISFDPAETIYTTGATDLFLEPVPVVEYPAQAFSRLFRPQSVEVADAGRTLWVPREDLAAGVQAETLEFLAGGRPAGSAALTPWRVLQIASVQRGYTIEPFEARATSSLTPDFSAMRLPRDSAATSIAMKGGGGERSIRRVSLPSDAVLFIPALLPVLVGLGLRLRTRGRAR